MSRLPRSPLLLAVALAAVPAVALVVMLGPARHRVPPPAAIATPTPVVTPQPTPLPQLVVPDRFDLAAAQAFGSLDLVGFDHHDDVDVTGYTLVVSLPSTTPSLPVWKLRGFADNANVNAFGARVGAAPASPPFPGDGPNGKIDVTEGSVHAGDSDQSVLINVGSRPANAEIAIAAVTRTLAQLGVAPQNADVSAQQTSSVQLTTWDVRFTRRPIDGIPVGFGSFTADVGHVQISDFGNVSRIDLDEPSVDGGAQYPLRSAAEAWTDVRRGHWFDECCDVFTGGPGGPAKVAFRADQVSLAYEQVGTPGYLVPMYVFNDSRNQLSLAVPALQAHDLVEPGGFRLTQPGGV